MNYWKFLPKDWQTASLIIVLVQLSMFAFLWQGQSHIKELLTNHVTGIEREIVELKKGQSELERKLDHKFDKLYEILLTDKDKLKK